MCPDARAKLPARGASTPYDSHSTFSCISLFLSNPIAHEVTCWTILWPASRVVNGAPHKRAVHRRPAITDMSVVHHCCKFNQMQSRICGMRPHPGTSVDFRCLSTHLKQLLPCVCLQLSLDSCLTGSPDIWSASGSLRAFSAADLNGESNFCRGAAAQQNSLSAAVLELDRNCVWLTQAHRMCLHACPWAWPMCTGVDATAQGRMRLLMKEQSPWGPPPLCQPAAIHMRRTRLAHSCSECSLRVNVTLCICRRGHDSERDRMLQNIDVEKLLLDEIGRHDQLAYD